MPVPPLSTVVLLSKERKGRLAPLPRTGGQGATLRLGGFDTGMAAFDHAGLVAFAVAAALSVAGNYVGHDGTLVVNTVLGDDHSKTDLLKIAGDTSGATNVQVINGGAGAPTVNGIKLVDVSGQSNGKFSLLGDYVTGWPTGGCGRCPCLHAASRWDRGLGWQLVSAQRGEEREPSSRMRCRASVRASRSIRARCRPCRRSTSFPAAGGRYRDDAAMPATALEAGSSMVSGGEVWGVEGGFQRLAGRRNRHDSGHHHLALADGRGPPTPRRSGRSADRRPYRAVRQCVVEDLDRERRRPHAYQGLGRGGTLTAGNNGFMWMARRRPWVREHLPFVHGRQEAGRGQAGLRLCVQRGNGQAHGAHRALVADAAGAAHMVVGVFRALSRCLGCRRIPAMATA